MDGGRRSNLQPPFVSDYPPARDNLSWASSSGGNAGSCAGMTRRRGRKYPPLSRSGRAGWPNRKPGWPNRTAGWRPRPGSGSWRRNWHRDKKRDKQQGTRSPHNSADPARPQGQATACPFSLAEQRRKGTLPASCTRDSSTRPPAKSFRRTGRSSVPTRSCWH